MSLNQTPLSDVKTCTQCKLEKLKSEFPLCSKRKDKLYSWCKSCSAQKSLLRRQSNPELAAKHQLYIRNNIERSMLYSARLRAKKYNLPIDIDLKDIIIPSICPILKIPLIQGTNSVHENSPSLDRIVPELGYTKNNIQIISYKANTMKNNATFDDLINFANWVHEFVKQRDCSSVDSEQRVSTS